MKHHIRRLRKHRNSLYTIVFILLVFQVIIFLSITTQIAQVASEQTVMRSDIENYITELENQIEETRKENQFSVNAISQEVIQQRSDIQGEIDLLKASQEDFSGVIDTVIKGVVSVVTDRSAGSGFAIAQGGYIVTNQHVIQDASTIKVHNFNGDSYTAQIIGMDSFTDLALLQIAGNIEPIPLAPSDNIQIGEKVIAIGNPLGLSFTVTEGIVSATDRTGPNGLPAYVQTDVTLNPGNSGGPLINKEGQVIGINNFKIGDAESLGFALESDVIIERINTFSDTIVIE